MPENQRQALPSRWTGALSAVSLITKNFRGRPGLAAKIPRIRQIHQPHKWGAGVSTERTLPRRSKTAKVVSEVVAVERFTPISKLPAGRRRYDKNAAVAVDACALRRLRQPLQHQAHQRRDHH